MSERILRAFMQLFAIGASLERLTHQSRQVVENFLKQQISLNRVAEYLALFDEHVKALQGVDDPTRARKKVALSSVKALRICTEVNKELNNRQKYIVFTRLAEFMNSSDEAITEPEKEFLETVATIFNISPDDLALCLAMTDRTPDPVKLDAHQVLLVRPDQSQKGTKRQHLQHDDIDGSLWFLHLKSIGIFFLRYNGSDALTVNGQPVDPHTVFAFTQGAVIRGQKMQPLYYSDILRCFLETKQESGIRMEARNLEFKFKSGRKGLNRLNFSATTGELVGIMGSSGAGKSTLLSVLNGTAKPSSGNLLVNGTDIYTEDTRPEGLIGNIPQDDLLIEELSVFQNLFYNTKLVFGDLSDEEITQKVMDVLESLGLSETRDLKVGNPLKKTISGGQRKRLNIALELIREPAVLFVDEPTSGLSSRDAENVMDLLKQLALTGKLVFVVIHQPSSDIYRMFDRLLILDTGGFPVYYGNPSDALIYFKQKVNFADADQSECATCGNINAEQIFNIIELPEVDEFGNQTRNRKISPADWFNWYSQKNAEHTEETSATGWPSSPGKKSNPFRQWRIFFTRDFLSKLSNTQYLAINLLEAPLLAAILAFIMRYVKQGSTYTYIDNPNVPAYIFICVIVAVFLGLSVSAEEIIRDRKILQRESFLHLSRNSYLFSKIALLFMISAIQTATFVLVGNNLLGIHGLTMEYWWVLFTTSCFANLLGLNISSGLDSVVTIYILIPFLIIPQILLSGVIVKFEKLNPVITSQSEVPVIGDIMTSRWAFEALAVCQFKENKFEKQFFELDATLSKATFKKDFWLPVLRERADKTERLLKLSAPADSIRPVLQLVKYELGEEQRTNPLVNLSSLPALNKESYTSGLPDEIRNNLDTLKYFYIELYNSTNDKKDALTERMTEQLGGNKSFMKLKRDYYNEGLDQMLRNANQTERIAVVDNKVIQRADPIFQLIPGNKFLRGMFFSPMKNFFGKAANTYAVNIFVIWVMTFLLYLALVFDLLRRFIQFSGRRKFKE